MHEAVYNQMTFGHLIHKYVQPPPPHNTAYTPLCIISAPFEISAINSSRYISYNVHIKTTLLLSHIGYSVILLKF